MCVCVCACVCEWGPHRGGCPLGGEWGSEHLLGGPEHEVRVDFQEVGIKTSQDKGVCATRTLRSGFQGYPWAWGCWGWEMAQQAEVGPAGRNPDLQRLGRGPVQSEGRGMALRWVSLGVGAGLGPQIGCEVRGGMAWQGVYR